MKKYRNLGVLFRLTWQICPELFFASLLGTLLSTGQTLIYVFIPSRIIDRLVQGDRYLPALMWTGILIGAIAVVKIIDLLTRPWRNACVNRADIATASYYMDLAAHTTYAEFEKDGYRNRLETAMSEVRINHSANFCSNIVAAAVSIVIYTAFLSSFGPIVLLVLLLSVGINTFVKIRSNRLEEGTVPKFRQNSRVFSYIDGAYSGFNSAKEVRINQTEELFESRYDEVNRERWKLETSYGRRKFLLNLLSTVGNALQIVFVYGYAGYLAWNGAMTLGTFSAYAASVLNFSGAFSQGINAFLDMELTLSFVPLYNEICALSKDSADGDSGSWQAGNGPEIAFENVTFCYPGTEKPVLSNVNIVLPWGCKLAVVGENGAGKTTFVKLLCRLYKPTSGKITVNGQDIWTIPREEYARLLSVVFQDFKLFSFDVADNIVLNAPFDRRRLDGVIAKSDLKEKVASLDQGIHTYVNKEFDDHGVEFSGGESQKLALARAYYKNSPIVILDEPTSALDANSELYLYNHFRSVIGESSAILISHRLASTAFCDRIAVFSDGKIVETGTHDELLAKNGIYSEMWNLQAELYTYSEKG